jgi:hypothetical protein
MTLTEFCFLLSRFTLPGPLDWNYLALQSFDYDRVWRTLFNKRVVRSKCNIHVFILILRYIVEFVMNVNIPTL